MKKKKQLSNNRLNRLTGKIYVHKHRSQQLDSQFYWFEIEMNENGTEKTHRRGNRDKKTKKKTTIERGFLYIV